MIDLRSDTVTKPDGRMREAMATAEVGDDVYGEDPTVNELQRRAARVVGMDAALFVPTGSMGNAVAARVHTERGQEVLVEREAHIYRWELASLAQHAQLQTRTLDGGDRGVPSPAQVHGGCVEADDHRPGTGLLCLENTHNGKGGTAIGPAAIRTAADAAHEHGVPVHLDGARLFNAAVAHGVDATDIVEPVDSVLFCLSKGLGAPVGSILAGDEAFVEAAHRVRRLLGGGMRQAGVIAAPGLVALENVERLADDHENAARLAEGITDLDGLSVQKPETNLVYVDISGTGLDAETFLARCREAGVLAGAADDRTVRFCTHLDVDRADVEAAIEGIQDAVE